MSHGYGATAEAPGGRFALQTEGRDLGLGQRHEFLAEQALHVGGAEPVEQFLPACPEPCAGPVDLGLRGLVATQRLEVHQRRAELHGAVRRAVVEPLAELLTERVQLLALAAHARLGIGRRHGRQQAGTRDRHRLFAPLQLEARGAVFGVVGQRGVEGGTEGACRLPARGRGGSERNHHQQQRREGATGRPAAFAPSMNGPDHGSVSARLSRSTSGLTR